MYLIFSYIYSILFYILSKLYDTKSIYKSLHFLRINFSNIIKKGGLD